MNKQKTRWQYLWAAAQMKEKFHSNPAEILPINFHLINMKPIPLFVDENLELYQLNQSFFVRNSTKEIARCAYVRHESFME